MRVFALRGHRNGNDETIEYVENVENVEYATSLVGESFALRGHQNGNDENVEGLMWKPDNQVKVRIIL